MTKPQRIPQNHSVPPDLRKLHAHDAERAHLQRTTRVTILLYYCVEAQSRAFVVGVRGMQKRGTASGFVVLTTPQTPFRYA